MITDADITAQVATAVGTDADLALGIDIDAITSEIIDTYGLVDVDTIDHDKFWAIVAKHDSGQPATPYVDFRSREIAEGIVALHEFVGNGIKLDRRGTAVEFTDDALAILADFDEERDGTNDGQSIWVGGTDYDITR